MAGEDRAPGAGAVAARRGRTDGRVARPERPREVEPAGDRPRGTRLGRTTAAGRGALVECRPGRAARTGLRSAGRVVAAGHRRVGLVDLGHLTRRDPRCLGIVADQVRVVATRELAPRGLDLGRRRGRADTEDDVRLPFRHEKSVSPANDVPGGRARLTGRRACPALVPCHDFAGRDRRSDRRDPVRARLSLRGRLPASRRLPASETTCGRPVGGGTRIRERRRALARDGRATGLVHPGARRRGGARGRDHPRLGVRARPDAADRRVPRRRRVPLSDDRRPRPRQQPARDTAGQRR